MAALHLHQRQTQRSVAHAYLFAKGYEMTSSNHCSICVRAMATLQAYGVPPERARNAANGIEVLMTRSRKEAVAVNATIERLRALLTEGKRVWCDTPLPGIPYPEYACGKCWTCRVRAELSGAPSPVETTPVRAYGPGMTPHADDCECYVCTRSRAVEQAGSNDALRSFEIIWSLILEQFPYWAVANTMHADNVRSALELSPEDLQRAVHILAQQGSAVEPTCNPCTKWDEDGLCITCGASLPKDCPHCREVYEVWAGSEHVAPETAPEAYQQRLIHQMRDASAKGLRHHEYGH
jgi:hypothetical protein